MPFLQERWQCRNAYCASIHCGECKSDSKGEHCCVLSKKQVVYSADGAEPALIAKPVSFEQACLKGMKGACGDGHLGLRGILCLVGIVLLGLSRETSPQP